VPLYRCRYQHLIPVPEVLGDSPSLQEILWKFCRFKDKKKRLTLRENPHFYTELPTSPEAFCESVKIDPTEDFRHGNKFYVLIDRPEPVYIMAGQVLQTFGNFWCPKDAIILKGKVSCFVISHVSDVFPDIRGRLRGESIVRGTYCGVCKLLPPVSTVPRASTNRRGLRPIITEGYPGMGWERSIGCVPIHSSVDIGLYVCTGQVASYSPVRYDVITYSTACFNIDLAPANGPLATNI
jgi:hypothetical protein